MEHIEPKYSWDFKLTVYSICSIRICSRKWDFFEKTIRVNFQRFEKLKFYPMAGGGGCGLGCGVFNRLVGWFCWGGCCWVVGGERGGGGVGVVGGKPYCCWLIKWWGGDEAGEGKLFIYWGYTPRCCWGAPFGLDGPGIRFYIFCQKCFISK